MNGDEGMKVRMTLVEALTRKPIDKPRRHIVAAVAPRAGELIVVLDHDVSPSRAHRWFVSWVEHVSTTYDASEDEARISTVVLGVTELETQDAKRGRRHV